MNRYHRQILLPQVGEAGQAALGAARVLLVGCGALGSCLAEQLVRAGVGFLRLADRDIVELTNLQRQVLFDEKDAARAWPKAAAAAERLGAINSAVMVEPEVVDVDSGNIEFFAGVDGHSPRVDLILDGTDNVATRYLLNDVAVKHGVPWIYGACVGTEGRVMAIRPGKSACLRCVFANLPKAEELATCDTSGVLGPVANVVASLQAVIAIKMLTGHEEALADELLTLDVWANRIRPLSLVDARREDCPCCGRRQFEFLDRPVPSGAVTLCGRDAVQVRGEARLDLDSLAERWASQGGVERNRFFTRCRLNQPGGVTLTVFADGRLIVQGTRDLARGRAIYARFVGS